MARIPASPLPTDRLRPMPLPPPSGGGYRRRMPPPPGSARRLLASAVVVAAIAVAAGCGSEGTGSEDAPTSDAVARAEAAAAAQNSRIAAAAEPLPAAERGPAVLRGTVTDITGRRVDLAGYRGRVVVMLNIASRCGFTDQLGGWERVWRENRSAGLVVVGAPSDDFRQEPKGDDAIREFCERRYGVTFPLLAKGRVTGPGAQPPYDRIATLGTRPAGPPTWNFTAFVIDREGRLAARIEGGLGPDAPRTAATVAAVLAEDTAPA